MRLLIIGTLGGQIGAASQIAIQRGATVQQADTIDIALQIMRAGQSADLIMADVNLQIDDLVKSLDRERMTVPVIACGVGNDTKAAVRAIRAGAKEYLPLPPDAELIAAVPGEEGGDSHCSKISWSVGFGSREDDRVSQNNTIAVKTSLKITENKLAG